jgi:hypothetical protein
LRQTELDLAAKRDSNWGFGGISLVCWSVHDNQNALHCKRYQSGLQTRYDAHEGNDTGGGSPVADSLKDHRRMKLYGNATSNMKRPSERGDSGTDRITVGKGEFLRYQKKLLKGVQSSRQPFESNSR